MLSVPEEKPRQNGPMLPEQRAGLSSVRLQPMDPSLYFNIQWHRHFDRTLHVLADQSSQGFDLILGHIKHQFIVHLQDHARFERRRLERFLNADHRHLDDVGRRALNGGVDGIALCKAADHRIG